MTSRLPSKGPNSPFSAGKRTILARTCKGCGELADSDSFPLLNPGTSNESRRWFCHHCQNTKKKYDRQERGIGLPRPPERLQIRKYQPWDTWEDEYLRDNVEAVGFEAVAVALGRSLNSVYTRRSVLGLPRVRKSHRVEKPWKIQS